MSDGLAVGSSARADSADRAPLKARVPAPAQGDAGAGAPLVVCRALGKRYGGQVALGGLDLALGAGAPIALVGPNGAGKTTLLSLLVGFVRPSAGEVRVLGERPGSARLAGRLAALPQDALLDPHLAVGRQLRLLAELQGFGRRAARAEAVRVLELVALAEVARRPPTALSHGMRKRVALAQALIGEPELVLLDEPTAGIDPENARAMRELITASVARTTFLISSHNLDELERLCGSLVQLEAGRLVRHEPLGGAAEPPSPADAPDTVAGELTVALVGVPDEAFREAALALDGVRALRRLAAGEWLVDTADDSRVAAALLGLLAERGWRWRHLARGRSLEERLYGG